MLLHLALHRGLTVKKLVDLLSSIGSFRSISSLLQLLLELSEEEEVSCNDLAYDWEKTTSTMKYSIPTISKTAAYTRNTAAGV